MPPPCRPCFLCFPVSIFIWQHITTHRLSEREETRFFSKHSLFTPADMLLTPLLLTFKLNLCPILGLFSKKVRKKRFFVQKSHFFSAVFLSWRLIFHFLLLMQPFSIHVVPTWLQMCEADLTWSREREKEGNRATLWFPYALEALANCHPAMSLRRKRMEKVL